MGCYIAVGAFREKKLYLLLTHKIVMLIYKPPNSSAGSYTYFETPFVAAAHPLQVPRHTLK